MLLFEGWTWQIAFGSHATATSRMPYGIQTTRAIYTAIRYQNTTFVQWLIKSRNFLCQSRAWRIYRTSSYSSWSRSNTSFNVLQELFLGHFASVPGIWMPSIGKMVCGTTIKSYPQADGQRCYSNRIDINWSWTYSNLDWLLFLAFTQISVTWLLFPNNSTDKLISYMNDKLPHPGYDITEILDM